VLYSTELYQTGDPMARNDPQMHVRVKKESKEWLEQQAEANKRTLTTELAVILEDAQRRQQQEKEEAHAT
jgi:hypothetical protein